MTKVPPTREQLVGGEPLMPDHEVILQHFLGKTVEEAAAMIHSNVLFYADDFYFMNPEGLGYYLGSIRHLLKSPEFRPEDCSALLSALEFQIHDGALPPTLVTQVSEITAQLRALHRGSAL
jgi:hypothetical protein